jgi:hypothetical protein
VHEFAQRFKDSHGLTLNFTDAVPTCSSRNR